MPRPMPTSPHGTGFAVALGVSPAGAAVPAWVICVRLTWVSKGDGRGTCRAAVELRSAGAWATAIWASFASSRSRASHLIPRQNGCHSIAQVTGGPWQSGFAIEMVKGLWSGGCGG
jgi:hypothetical protein